MHKLRLTLIMKKQNLVERIGKYYYEQHALERMQSRNLFPCIIEHVIETGDHYKLKLDVKEEEAKCATDAYIKFNMANILPGGMIGNRIITINPYQVKRFQHVIVFTGWKGVVKTAYVAKNQRVKAFIKNYCILK